MQEKEKSIYNKVRTYAIDKFVENKDIMHQKNILSAWLG